MPHCIIEYSKGLNPTPLVESVFEGTVASGLFNPDGSDVKVRPIPFEHFKVGGEQDNIWKIF